jgi:hypothetical protein
MQEGRSLFVIPGQAAGLSLETMNTRIGLRALRLPQRPSGPAVVMRSGLFAARSLGMTGASTRRRRCPKTKRRADASFHTGARFYRSAQLPIRRHRQKFLELRRQREL